MLDQAGQGDTSDVVAAIEFILAERQNPQSTLPRIDVINLSLGHPIYESAATDPLVQAVERASAAGIVVVASAGNNGQRPDTGAPGYAGLTSPGNAPSAITAGAASTSNSDTRDDDRVAPFSSRGPTWYDAFAKPDVVAPGLSLMSDIAPFSTLYDQLRGCAGCSDTKVRLSGSSMAAAVTSGIVALVLDQNRQAHDGAPGSHAACRQGHSRVHRDAAARRRRRGLRSRSRKGAGEVNAAGAVALASAIDPRVRRLGGVVDHGLHAVHDGRERQLGLVSEHHLGHAGRCPATS